MSSANTHRGSSAHTSLGAYAADALDTAEALGVEYHLTECEVCRAEFDEFSETAAELTRLVETPPPAALKTSVLRSITQVRPLPPQLDDDVAVRRAVRAQTRRAQRRPAGRALLAVAAAAIAVAIGAGGYAVNTHEQLASTQSAQAVATRNHQLTQQETAILQAPDAAVYSSRLQDGSSVSYLVSRRLNAAMMISGALADPGSGRTFQLWTLVRTTDGGVDYVPDHTFGGGPDQRVLVTGDVSDAVGLAITVEPTGGSLHPTGEPDARTTF